MLTLTPELSAKFTIISNALSSIGLIRQIEIGDTAQPFFYPQIKTSHWNGESSFSQRLIIPGYTPNDNDVTSIGSIVRLSTPNLTIEWEDIGSENEGGLTEERITFITKPATNLILSTLETTNIVVEKQPVLSGTEDGIDSEGNPFHVPFNVQGSYALFHATKWGGQYQAGKLGHLYRPLITASDLTSDYCDIDINLPLKQMTITIPASFYNTALLPWVMK